MQKTAIQKIKKISRAEILAHQSFGILSIYLYNYRIDKWSWKKTIA
jgi:hypothetical protein